MADFMPFDLGQAYIQGENVLRSRTLREEAQKRTAIDAESLALEARKAEEEREMWTLLPLVKAGRPEAIQRVVERIAGSNVRLAKGAVDVRATRSGKTLTTVVTRHALDSALTVGHVLPNKTKVGSVTLDGEPVSYRIVATARGQEVVAEAGAADAAAVNGCGKGLQAVSAVFT